MSTNTDTLCKATKQYRIRKPQYSPYYKGQAEERKRKRIGLLHYPGGRVSKKEQ